MSTEKINGWGHVNNSKHHLFSILVVLFDFVIGWGLGLFLDKARTWRRFMSHLAMMSRYLHCEMLFILDSHMDGFTRISGKYAYRLTHTAVKTFTGLRLSPNTRGESFSRIRPTFSRLRILLIKWWSNRERIRVSSSAGSLDRGKRKPAKLSWSISPLWPISLDGLKSSGMRYSLSVIIWLYFFW